MLFKNTTTFLHDILCRLQMRNIPQPSGKPTDIKACPSAGGICGFSFRPPNNGCPSSSLLYRFLFGNEKNFGFRSRIFLFYSPKGKNVLDIRKQKETQQMPAAIRCVWLPIRFYSNRLPVYGHLGFVFVLLGDVDVILDIVRARQEGKTVCVLLVKSGCPGPKRHACCLQFVHHTEVVLASESRVNQALLSGKQPLEHTRHKIPPPSFHLIRGREDVVSFSGGRVPP